jgi:hypothetical protein
MLELAEKVAHMGKIINQKAEWDSIPQNLRI